MQACIRQVLVPTPPTEDSLVVLSHRPPLARGFQTPVWFRGPYRLLNKRMAESARFHSRVALTRIPWPIAIEDIGGHIGMGLVGRSSPGTAPYMGSVCNDNAGRRRAQHLNPISPRVWMRFGRGTLSVGEPTHPMCATTPNYEDAVCRLC